MLNRSCLRLVDDVATEKLMVSFYEELMRGTKRSESLRRAQLKFLNGHHSDPFYWAAFVLSGNGWEPLEVSRPN